ncbi:hypothetical protein [Halorussus sp. MSC15.2]|uniref:hypothetical protein n=1 Tax=Halorussus sp. MSC15.2 TaxID=2283638 RepID=UPI0013D09267|nr:hypothetical protein [Halorussus sp. MSC15.2]NEU59218.1 hypothetical protein [Halorussus sp. MSC15.2]
MPAVSTQLLQELESRLPDIPEGVYQTFTHETDFIDIAVQQLDYIHCSTGTQSARIQVKELHQSPYIRYPRPSYIRDTNPELGDILYIVNYFESGQVVERRASIAQAKFTKGSYDNRKDRVWKTQMHQFHLLDTLRNFRFDWKDADKRFTITDKNKSLTTYIFASNFLPPFFQTVDRSKWYLYDKESDPTKYTLPRQEPWDVNKYTNQVLSLIRRQYGQAFEQGDTLHELITYMFDHQRPKTFTSGRSSNSLVNQSGDPIPDGGETESASNPMKVVLIDVGLDTTSFDSDTPNDINEEELKGLYDLGRRQLRDIE